VSINVAKLELAMMQKINDASTELELLTYQKVLEQLRTGSVNTVSTYANLPAASENTGKLYFVESEESVYFGYDGVSYVNLVDTVRNTIFSFGNDISIGDFDTNCVNKSTATQEATGDYTWTCYAAKGSNAAAIKSDGTLWTWGSGAFSSLGRSGCCISPGQELTSSTNWRTVNNSALSGNFMNAIKNDGTLWSWGYNPAGNLITNSGISQCITPVQEISSSENWISSSGGDGVMIGLKADGTLWMGGSCGRGILGNNLATPTTSSPVQEFFSDTTWCYADVGAGSFVCQTAHGIKTDGTLWSWGSGLGGKIGIGVCNSLCYSTPMQEMCSATNWKTVSAGNNQIASLKNDGSLWIWGNNGCGSLGQNNTTDSYLPIQEYTSSTDWCSALSGFYHVAVLKTDGTLWGWGSNSSCQLGDGTSFSRSSPVQEICFFTNWSTLAVFGSSTGGIRQDVL